MTPIVTTTYSFANATNTTLLVIVSLGNRKPRKPPQDENMPSLSTGDQLQQRSSPQPYLRTQTMKSRSDLAAGRRKAGQDSDPTPTRCLRLCVQHTRHALRHVSPRLLGQCTILKLTIYTRKLERQLEINESARMRTCSTRQGGGGWRS